MINPKIFKAYDIRGLYPQEIDEEAAKQITLGLVDFLKPRTVVVGCDARKSSPTLKEAVVESFLRAGVNVLDLGYCSTPLLCFAIINQKADGGVMVTASHNPPQYNGLKLYGKDARDIDSQTGSYQIRDKVLAGLIPELDEDEDSDKRGSLRDIHLTKEYVQKVMESFEPSKIKPLKIIADAGNGMAGSVIEQFFSKIPASLVRMYFRLDGSFPNHEANPSKEATLDDLKKKIEEEKADFGVAFDGDGDRIIFVDENSQVIRGDFITAFMAKKILAENPGEKIYYEVRSSKIVPEIIKKSGGQPLMSKAGRSFIKGAMQKDNAIFGGELTGHYFFRQFSFVENPTYILLSVIKELSVSGKKMSEIFSEFAQYYQSQEINFKVANADKTLQEVENNYFNAEIEKIDGLTVRYSDWWFNLRKSNTEPLVRLNMEADTLEILEEKLAEVSAVING